MARVVLEHVTKRFGSVVAVDDLSLAIEDREFLVLLGPSGCGKTTVLRVIAGLVEPDRGTVVIGERVVNGVPPKQRDIAMVFQNYALYPHLSVFDNLAFALRMRGFRGEERRRMVEEAARILGLERLLGRRPAELSGGQRQRVALGRAIVRRPQAFLMDEPLSNLDAKLRVQTRAELIKLHRRLEGTFIYVTHDQVEAMTMGSRIAILQEGRLQQVGGPQEVYQRPANLFVAAFIGSPAMNFFEVDLQRRDGSPVAQGEGAEFCLTEEQASALDRYGAGKVIIGVRPEHLEVRALGERGDGLIPATVDTVESLGHELHVSFRSGPREVVARLSPELSLQPGDEVALRAAPGRLLFFEPESGRRIEADLTKAGSGRGVGG